MPRAKPFPDSEEEEKTTIENSWEDEGSTTVEQGEVADKIRALGVEPRRGGTNSTHTSANPLDETVDEQQAQSAITPVRDVARLAITAGNDAGNEIEIRPGKTYTIGRAIDNDVVLTDIAVSRKHFDLRFEDGAWVIVDRGSGNGTVVNGNLEDNPFMLANGDVIEIGNTIFRFDQPNAASRSQRTVDLDRDDEELSTVAGKPLRQEMPIAQPVALPRPARQKTLPPPMPRGSNNSTQPPLGYNSQAAQPVAPMATGTQPAPTMLGAPPPQAMPVQVPQQRPIYPYPQATEIPPHSVHAQMLLIQTQARRNDGSTAHVQSLPYDAVVAAPLRYSQPQLTKRAKLVLAGVGAAVLAAVMTVAIVKSGGSKKTVAKPEPDKVKLDAKPMKVVAKPAADEVAPVQPTVMPTVAKTEPTKAEPTKAEPTKTEPTKTDPAKTEPAKTEPAKTEPTKAEPTKTEPAKTVAKAEPAKVEPVKTVAKTETKPKTEPKTEPKRRETRPTPTPTPTPTKRVATADPDAAKNQADTLYRAKKFNEASAYLVNAAKKADDDDAKDLRRISDTYAKLGRALSQGTAPATKSTDAFEALRQAQSFDRNLGNAFDSEIQTKLAQVAPKAALLYVANKNWPAARAAMLVAQQFGASESVKIVAQKLESAASELYNEGVRELENNPTSAREKFRQIKTMVDAKSTWYQKAQKQLNGG